jgi:hypothetical protein
MQSHEAGVKFDVCLHSNAHAKYRNACIENFELVHEAMVLDIDVRNASAFCDEDRDMIFGWIEEGVGFVEMNQVVKSAIRKWMINAGLFQLKQLEKSLSTKQGVSGGDIGGRKRRELAKLRHSLANVMYNMDYYKECVVLYRKDLSETIKAYGEDNNETISSKSSLASALNMTGKSRKAEGLSREVVAWRTNRLAKLHPRTLQSMTTLAEALRENQMLNEAEHVVRAVIDGHAALLNPGGNEDSLKILKTENPPETSHILRAKNCLCLVLRDQKRYEESLALLHMQMVEVVAFRGSKHPHVQLVTSWAAAILEVQGKFVEAEIMMQFVVENWWEQFGKNHSSRSCCFLILFIMSSLT